MREGAPSLTAMVVAAARAAAGIDAVAERLVPRGVLVATAVASFGLVAHLRLRTRAIDDVVREGAERDVVQIVVLGAGLDARAWRLEATQGAVVYEIDHPATQAFKRRRLGDERMLARDVVFVGVDFEKDDLAVQLERAGHDAARPTTWLWEGVTPYLTPAAIDATLAIVGRRSAPGSALAMTYVTPEYGEVPRVLAPLVRPAFRLLGEPLRGTMTTEAAAAALERHGLTPVRDDAIADLSARLSAPRPWRALAEHLVVATPATSGRRSSS
ncbi:MAG: class I SAM-dependent methyltransferase [Labilithrix sp.]|nr:class I SAM-dependent methyltransferase [Labilithrix sp.]MCW5809415.1 class I SAM-dependent methyltransferase [Labilithrix sp.]